MVSNRRVIFLHFYVIRENEYKLESLGFKATVEFARQLRDTYCFQRRIEKHVFIVCRNYIQCR